MNTSKELDWGSEALQRTLHRSGHCEERHWQQTRYWTWYHMVYWPLIGLYSDPQIYWSDGSNYSFSSWYQGFHRLGSMKEVCGVADLEEGGNWRLISCEERKPFVCYSITSENLFLSSSISTGLTVGFTKLNTTWNVCFVSLLVLCLSSSEDVGAGEGEAPGLLCGPEWPCCERTDSETGKSPKSTLKHELIHRPWTDVLQSLTSSNNHEVDECMLK